MVVIPLYHSLFSRVSCASYSWPISSAIRLRAETNIGFTIDPNALPAQSISFYCRDFPNLAHKHLTRTDIHATPLLAAHQCEQKLRRPVNVVQPPRGPGVPDLERAVVPEQQVLEELAQPFEDLREAGPFGAEEGE